MSYLVRVVNMISKSRSGETDQDSEPSLTVDPDDADVIVGFAALVRAEWRSYG